MCAAANQQRLVDAWLEDAAAREKRAGEKRTKEAQQRWKTLIRTMLHAARLQNERVDDGGGAPAGKGETVTKH